MRKYGILVPKICTFGQNPIINALFMSLLSSNTECRPSFLSLSSNFNFISKVMTSNVELRWSEVENLLRASSIKPINQKTML